MANTVNNHGMRPAQLRRLADELLRWFEEHRRDLPWRRSRDPYAIWVSEVMLQQTRVEAVVAPFDRFLRRFPDLPSLAAASENEVLAQWAGLGYYRRARQLHAAARLLAEDGQGQLPRSSAALRLLPGFGPYTAGAVASIAFGEAVPAIDGNVQRVLARVLALEEDPSRRSGSAPIEVLARGLLGGSPPSELNQALMELGALVCTPRKPFCETCPWTQSCRARRAGVAELLPRRTPRPETSTVSCYAAVVRDGPRFLWRQREEGEHNAGLWELPTTRWHAGEPDPGRGHRELEGLGEELGREWRVGDAMVTVRHSITRYRVRCVGHEILDSQGQESEGLRWGSSEEAEAWGITAAARKFLAKLPPLF